VESTNLEADEKHAGGSEGNYDLFDQIRSEPEGKIRLLSSKR